MPTTTQPVQPENDPNALQLAPKPKPTNPLATQASPLTLAQAPAPPTPAAAPPAPPVDRVALATKAFDTFQTARAPEAQKGIDRVTSQAAGMGQLGSGQWRTALRDENARQELTLSTERDRLINSAIEGTIGDRQAADQLELAKTLGQGNLDIARTNADTSRLGTTGNLALAEKGLAQSGEQFGQSLDFQKEQAKIEAAFKAGTMTLAQKDQALRELANAQQNTLATSQLELAKTGQAADIATQKAQLDLAKAGQTQQGAQFDKQLAFQQEQAKIEAAYKAGTLSLAQAQQKLAELANTQQNTLATSQLELAKTSQADTQANETARIQLAKEQIAQQAEQFGLSQTQQMALAKLQDATANRSLDISTAQGKNSLLLELARILGGPTGTLNSAALAAIAQSFGVVLPGAKSPTTSDGKQPTDTGF